MPAAAVIPALIAYIKVVAVKKLVVESRRQTGGRPSVRLLRLSLSSECLPLNCRYGFLSRLL